MLSQRGPPGPRRSGSITGPDISNAPLERNVGRGVDGRIALRPIRRSGLVASLFAGPRRRPFATERTGDGNPHDRNSYPKV